jgi:hypothetical protein
MSGSEDTAERDFFISYAHADRAWAEWMGWQLETAGYTTVLQAWDFSAGSDWAHEMQRATTSARRTIAVLSSAYLQSAYGEAEWRVAFARDPTGSEGLLLPVRVEEIEPPGVLRTRVYIDLVGANQQTARSRLLEGIGQGRLKPALEPPFPDSAGQPAREAPRFPGHGPEITNLPARNPSFTGRETFLEMLHVQLHAAPDAAEPRVAAIYGLGGVGKTELALEYAHRHAADYDVAWWIPGDRTTSIVAALAELARHLGVDVLADQGDMVVELFSKLRGRGRWLLVYDNAGQAENLTPLLPPGGGGHLLVTSRTPAWRRVTVPLALKVLERAESVTFLCRRTQTDKASADALAELLGDLPLALEEAAAYLEETQVGLGAYLRLAHERMSELFGLEQPTRDEQRVATTWSVALDRVRVEAPAAEALLDLCAFFARDDIPRELPGRFPERLPHPLAQAAADPLAYNDAMRALGRYSLATVTPTAVAVHRLVQAVVRARLDNPSQRRWAGIAVGLLYESFPDRSWEASTWPTCQRLLPHVLAATEHAERLGVADEEAGVLLDRVSDYLRGRGQPRQARPIAEGALAITMAALGPDDPATGDRHDTLGRILRDLGDLRGARAELERAPGQLRSGLRPRLPGCGHPPQHPRPGAPRSRGPCRGARPVRAGPERLRDGARARSPGGRRHPERDRPRALGALGPPGSTGTAGAGARDRGGDVRSRAPSCRDRPQQPRQRPPGPGGPGRRAERAGTGRGPLRGGPGPGPPRGRNRPHQARRRPARPRRPPGGEGRAGTGVGHRR